MQGGISSKAFTPPLSPQPKKKNYFQVASNNVSYYKQLVLNKYFPNLPKETHDISTARTRAVLKGRVQYEIPVSGWLFAPYLHIPSSPKSQPRTTFFRPAHVNTLKYQQALVKQSPIAPTHLSRLQKVWINV